MKIAVLISGEYRTFNMCRPTMKFLDDPRVDVYMSTWDKTVYHLPEVGLHREEDITLDEIKSVLGRPATILLEPYDSFTDVKYCDRMIHRWIKGFDLIKNSGLEYDYVLITRPDLFYRPGTNVLATEGIESNSNAIEFRETRGKNGEAVTSDSRLMDVLMYGNYQIMAKLFATLTVAEWVNSNVVDFHSWWYDIVVNKLKIDVVVCEKRAMFCRLGSERLEKNILLAQNMAKVIKDWSDLTSLNYHRVMSKDTDNTRFDGIANDANIMEIQQKWTNGYYDEIFGLKRQ